MFAGKPRTTQVEHAVDDQLGGSERQAKRRDSDRNERDRQRYMARKLAGQCVICGKRAAEGKQLCRFHVRIKARRDEEVYERRKARLEKAKLCRRCGKVKCKAAVCRACLALMGRLPTIRVPRPDQGPPRERERDADNRMRYHGQSRRGAPSKEREIELDLKQIEKSVAQVHAGLVDVKSAHTTVEECDAMLHALGGVADLIRRTADDLRRKLVAGNYAAALAKRAARAALKQR